MLIPRWQERQVTCGKGRQEPVQICGVLLAASLPVDARELRSLAMSNRSHEQRVFFFLLCRFCLCFMFSKPTNGTAFDNGTNRLHSIYTQATRAGETNSAPHTILVSLLPTVIRYFTVFIVKYHSVEKLLLELMLFCQAALFWSQKYYHPATWLARLRYFIMASVNWCA